MAPPPLPELQNFTKIADVFICVKILECWGKKCRRPNRFVKLSSFGVKSTNFVLSSNHFQPLPPDLKCKFYISIYFTNGVKFGLKVLFRHFFLLTFWNSAPFLPPTPATGHCRPLFTPLQSHESHFECFFLPRPNISPSILLLESPCLAFCLWRFLAHLLRTHQMCERAR